MQKIGIALEKLHTVAFMLPKMAFELSSKVVALHLDKSNDKVY